MQLLLQFFFVLFANCTVVFRFSIAFGRIAYGPGWFFDESTDEWRQHEIPSVSHVKEREFRCKIDARRFPRLPLYAFVQFVLVMAFGLAFNYLWNDLNVSAREDAKSISRRFLFVTPFSGLN